METQISKRPVAQLSIESRLLYEQLKLLQIGERVTYIQLSDTISSDVRVDAKSALCTARHIAQRDNHMIFECIRGEGLVRLDDKQIIATGDGALRKMGRLCRRSAKKLLCVDSWDKLSNEDCIRHNARVSLFGAVEQMTRPSKIKMIEERVGAGRSDQLSIGRTLEVYVK